MLLIKNARIYAPEPLGCQDILLAAGKIIAIGPELSVTTTAVPVEVIDAAGCYAVPGYVDQHLHAIGGGGEAGPYSRTPEVMLSSIVRAGVTTVVGLLGTDGTTRHLESLLAKVRALETEGITAYMLTGSYELPSQTLTGEVRRDLILIDKVLGVKLALSDHRSSVPTLEELIRLATQARVGGMLAGKVGVVQLHMGVGKANIQPVLELLERTEIPAKHFIPTHVNREAKLFTAVQELARRGGYMDITSGIRRAEGFTTCIEPAQAIAQCYQSGVPMSQVTMSSDGNGCMAVQDQQTQQWRLLVTKEYSLHEELRKAIVEEQVPMEVALAVVTRNPAQANGLWPRKGQLAVGSDADLVLWDSALQLQSVIAGGRVLLHKQELLVRGTFEE